MFNYEDTGLYRAMMEVKNETPLSLEEALIELINEKHFSEVSVSEAIRF